jgi:hypothetical protein
MNSLETVSSQAIEPQVSVNVIAENSTGRLKTVASGKPVAFDPDQSESLVNLRACSQFDEVGDWVFASPTSAGNHKDDRLAHTFKRTYAILLKFSGEM